MIKKHLFRDGMIITLLFCALTPVHAERDKRGQKKQQHAEQYRLDNRYHHDRNYPRQGYVIDRLPQHNHRIHYRDRDFFFYGGIWYRPSGSRFIIVAPPIGIVVPSLPAFYTTLWISGTPYYYANDAYYVWQPDRNGYVVTNPPADIDQQTPSVVADELFIYPKQGQSEQQQADDRYACHSWSVSQTHYDPSQSATTAGNALNEKRESYQRALRACMDAKGYSVR